MPSGSLPTRRDVLIGVSRAVLAGLVLPGVTAACGAARTPIADPRPAPANPLPPVDEQSPIDIVLADARPAPGPLVFQYPESVALEVEYVHRDGDSGCRMRDREETVEAVVPPGVAFVERDGTRFELKQFHFHIASEHRLDGRQLPMEQHFVHRSADGQVLVVAVFLVEGGRATMQDQVLANLPQECGESIPVDAVRLREGLPADLANLHYPGSLTTSPFTGGVLWHVVREQKRIDAASIAAFRGLFPDGDTREPQPLGRRPVQEVPGRLG
jgi:carbonic anhydrase